MNAFASDQDHPHGARRGRQAAWSRSASAEIEDPSAPAKATVRVCERRRVPGRRDVGATLRGQAVHVCELRVVGLAADHDLTVVEAKDGSLDALRDDHDERPSGATTGAAPSGSGAGTASSMDPASTKGSRTTSPSTIRTGTASARRSLVPLVVVVPVRVTTAIVPSSAATTGVISTSSASTTAQPPNRSSIAASCSRNTASLPK